MYLYDEYDQRLVHQRAKQFRDQVRRRLSGELTEDQFKPLRLQNGLYLQLHAYMLRVAVPYGLLSSAQMRALAHVARTYDKDYGHFTTRQNIQFNWPKLEDVPSILDDLAKVEMHAIQTSGNCVRNITSDPFAGVAKDEIEDPRPYCEVLRQWSTFHPEFAHLPRKFKIAVTGAEHDRAAILFHDIGLRLVKNDAGEVGFAVYAGGGQGRTPAIAEEITGYIPKRELLRYVEAILRVYNLAGRRDNKYKARIKILVKELGLPSFQALVEEEFKKMANEPLDLDDTEINRMKSYFVSPAYDENETATLDGIQLKKNRDLADWAKANVLPHKQRGYCIVQLSLKQTNVPPGDVTSSQMDNIANLADEYSFGLIVATHRQNLVFTDVAISKLEELYGELLGLGLASPNVDRITDIIACPGLDYCDLANARSIPVAEAISERFVALDRLTDLGKITLNISGCINACGHHHVANIGVLGIDKQGGEFYQLTLGGSHEDDAAIGKILGRALPGEEVPDAIEKIADTYLKIRQNADESFLTALRRVGFEPFKTAVYGESTLQKAF